MATKIAQPFASSSSPYDLLPATLPPVLASKKKTKSSSVAQKAIEAPRSPKTRSQTLQKKKENISQWTTSFKNNLQHELKCWQKPEINSTISQFEKALKKTCQLQKLPDVLEKYAEEFKGMPDKYPALESKAKDRIKEALDFLKSSASKLRSKKIDEKEASSSSKKKL